MDKTVVTPRSISTEARRTLAFLGDAIAEQYARVIQMSDAELRLSIKHCEECSETNCGWYHYAAAREDVAQTAGYQNVKSSGFAKALSRLSSLGFVTYPSSGQVIASSLCFLESH